MRRNITGPIQEEEKVPIVYLPAKSKGYETGRDCATPVRYRDLKKKQPTTTSMTVYQWSNRTDGPREDTKTMSSFVFTHERENIEMHANKTLHSRTLKNEK